MYAYIIIKPDSIQLVPSKDYKFTIEELWAGANCNTIQIVRSSVDDTLLMCIDDNGKLVDKPINTIATWLYAPEYDFIVGDVVLGTSLSPNYMDEPDIYKLDYELAERIMELLENVQKDIRHICGN